MTEPRRKTEAYWREEYVRVHQEFALALSGLAWAVGKLGDEAGYAGKVFEQVTSPGVVPPDVS